MMRRGIRVIPVYCTTNGKTWVSFVYDYSNTCKSPEEDPPLYQQFKKVTKPKFPDDVVLGMNAYAMCFAADDWRGALYWAEYVWMRARQLFDHETAETYGGYWHAVNDTATRIARSRGIKLKDFDRWLEPERRLPTMLDQWMAKNAKPAR